jgi:hypothetical protein
MYVLVLTTQNDIGAVIIEDQQKMDALKASGLLEMARKAGYVPILLSAMEIDYAKRLLEKYIYSSN